MLSHSSVLRSEVVTTGKSLICNSKKSAHLDLLLATEDSTSLVARALQTGMYTAKVRLVVQALLESEQAIPVREWFEALPDDSLLQERDDKFIVRAMKRQITLTMQSDIDGKEVLEFSIADWRPLLQPVFSSDEIDLIESELEEFNEWLHSQYIAEQEKACLQ